MHEKLRPPRHVSATIGLTLACLFWGLSFPASKALTLLYLNHIPGESSWLVVGLQGILSKIDRTQFRMDRGECETLLRIVFYTVQILVFAAPGFFQNRTKMVSTVMFFSTGVVFASVAVLSNHSIDSYKIAAGIG